MNTVFIWAIGLPGSGKTTLARLISQRFSIPFVSTEQVRACYLGILSEKKDCDFTVEEQKNIYEAVLRTVRAQMDSRKSIIVEGVYRTTEQRNDVIQLLKNYQGIRCYFFYIYCEEKEAKKRLYNRKELGTVSPAGVNSYEMIKNEFQMLGIAENFVCIDNTCDIDKSFSTICEIIQDRK